jgi:hypothetical protein
MEWNHAEWNGINRQLRRPRQVARGGLVGRWTESGVEQGAKGKTGKTGRPCGLGRQCSM